MSHKTNARNKILNKLYLKKKTKKHASKLYKIM